MYKSSSFGRRREKNESWKEILPVIWSTAWRVITPVLCAWGGSEILMRWNENFPESFPISINWMRRIIGGEIGGIICLLFVILPMNRIKNKK